MCDQCGGFVRDAIEHEIDAGLISMGGRTRFVGQDVSAVADLLEGDQVTGPNVLMVAGPGGLEIHPLICGLEASRAAARKVAKDRGHHVALATVVKAVDLTDGRATVLRARYLYEPHNTETLHAMASAVLPEAMAKLAALEPVQKEIDPLDPRYFDRLAANLSAYMSRKFDNLSAPVFGRWINDLVNRNWANATEAELRLLTRQLNTSFRTLSGKHWTNIRGQVYHRSEGLSQGVKRATVKRYNLGISPNLALKDLGAIRQITASHAHYVTDAMGNIAAGASQQARAIVRNGLAKGLGSKTIGADLHRALGATLTGRTRAYFDMAAISILNRSQSYSKLVTFQEAGVNRMVWVSVLDEITTRACRFADGKIFSVRKALGSYAKTAALTNPQEVKFTQPWLRQRKIKKGKDKGLWGLYLPERDGGMRLVSTELVSGFGRVNDRGQWRDAMNIETLEDMGYSAPPGHGGCRSTIAPDMIPPRFRSRRVQTPAPRPKTPLIDPMGNKGPAWASTGNGALAYYDRLRLMQAEQAVAAGRQPLAVSKYDGVLNRVKSSGAPPVFSRPKGLDLVSAQSLAQERIRGILLAALPTAVSELREVRLSARLKAKDAYGPVQYDEKARVLTMSKESASGKADGAKQATGRQLAYALELERRRARKGTITAEDRAAARDADLTNSVGTLFDAEALEKVP